MDELPFGILNIYFYHFVPDYSIVLILYRVETL